MAGIALEFMGLDGVGTVRQRVPVGGGTPTDGFELIFEPQTGLVADLLWTGPARTLHGAEYADAIGAAVNHDEGSGANAILFVGPAGGSPSSFTQGIRLINPARQDSIDAPISQGAAVKPLLILPFELLKGQPLNPALYPASGAQTGVARPMYITLESRNMRRLTRRFGGARMSFDNEPAVLYAAPARMPRAKSTVRCNRNREAIMELKFAEDELPGGCPWQRIVVRKGHVTSKTFKQRQVTVDARRTPWRLTWVNNDEPAVATSVREMSLRPFPATVEFVFGTYAVLATALSPDAHPDFKFTIVGARTGYIYAQAVVPFQALTAPEGAGVGPLRFFSEFEGDCAIGCSTPAFRVEINED